MPDPRRFPPPWHADKITGGYIVRDANGQSIAFVFHRPDMAEEIEAKVLTPDEARRIAVNIARLPELLKLRVVEETVAVPRWVKSKDHEPAPWKPNYSDDDWLLISGHWVIGRVLPAYGDPQPGRYNWSLTGPQTPQAPIPTRGTADSDDAAKAELLASWRRWQDWAGMKDRD